MERLPKPRRKVYPWTSPLPDWEWGREMSQRLEVIEERKLREKETDEHRH